MKREMPWRRQDHKSYGLGVEGKITGETSSCNPPHVHTTQPSVFVFDTPLQAYYVCFLGGYNHSVLRMQDGRGETLYSVCSVGAWSE